MKIQCVVIDKSPSQQRAISKLIDKFKSIELTASFSEVMEFKKQVSLLNIELLIVDINMPMIDGIELLKLCKPKPEVIFMSNSKKDAYKAIKYHPVDYLVKPIDSNEFEVAVKKAIDFIEKNRLQNQHNEAYITVTSDAQKQRVKLNDILWIEALGDYVCIITQNKKMVVHSTMYSFEQKLPEKQFVRIHKSYIVNQNKILSYNSKEVDLLGKKLPLSRSKKHVLDAAFSEI